MKKTVIAFSMAFFAIGIMKAGDTTSGKTVTPLDGPPPGSCLTYDYIDLEYGSLGSDDAFLGGGDRWGIGFSKSITSNLFFTAGYSSTQYDYIWNNQVFGLDNDRIDFGLGGHMSLSECVDLTFEGGGVYSDTSFGGNGVFDYDSWGYYVGPGIRARAGRLEGYAKVFYVGREGVLNQFGVDTEGWVFKPGVLFHLTDHLALKVAADVGELDSAVTFGARINF